MSRAQLTSTVEQNTGGAVSPYVAGKNKLINGDFSIAQRGTSIAVSGSNVYTLDRWAASPYGSGQPFTVSQQTATPPTSTKNYLQIVGNSTNATNIFITQSLETADVVKLQGKTVTLSFQYKVPTNFTATWSMNAYWGTATDTAIYNSGSGTNIFTTAITNNAGWVSASQTFVVPSTATQLSIMFSTFNNVVNNATLQIANVMLELGSVATPFTTATGTLQGELALAQRYFYKVGGDAAYQRFCPLVYASGTDVRGILQFPVSMRVAPSVSATGAFSIINGASLVDAVTSFGTSGDISTITASVSLVATTSRTAGWAGILTAGNSTATNIQCSAEL